MNTTIVIGSDHAGYRTKQAVLKALAGEGFTIVDVGTFNAENSVDYPDFAKQVGEAVASDRTGKTRGVLVCGTGTGMVMAANKIKGVRAAMVYDAYSAKMARHDNDANVIALRGRRFAASTAAKLAVRFLREPFSDLARHKRRIKKVAALERR